VTSPTRLGDLIRVVEALRPDDAQLSLIDALLPEHGTGGRPTRSPPGRPAPATAPLPPAPAAPARRAPAVRRKRTRTWPGRRGRPPRRREPGRIDLRPWVGGAVVLAVAACVAATGRVVIGGGLLVIGVAALSGSPRWRAWRRSVQRHSSRHDGLGAGADAGTGGAGAGIGAGGTPSPALTLERSEWRPPLPSAPLLRDGQRRAVATLLAGRDAPGEIDLVATIRAVAARRPLTTVPRRRRWRTSQGMHLHIDNGPALEPFRSDVEDLRRALVSVAAAHAITEYGFVGDPRWITRPARVLGSRRRVALAARLPPPGTPVLVVTDLGIAVPRSGMLPEPEAFLDHHRRLREAGCHVHYLVPYPADRWPVDDLPVLHWTDDLGATDVLARLRREKRSWC
jgi:hypothetical protein